MTKPNLRIARLGGRGCNSNTFTSNVPTCHISKKFLQQLLSRTRAALNGQTCLPHKVGGRACKVLATLYFMATAFIVADGQSSPSPLYLRHNLKIRSTHSKLNRLGRHQFGNRRNLNPGPLGLQSSVLTINPLKHDIAVTASFHF